MKIRLVVFGFVSISLLTLSCLNADDEQSSGKTDQEKSTSDFKLKMRSNNGAYETSAFSFRSATQEINKHQNYVDLVYNGCGSLHFNPVGRMTNRVADLGEMKLDEAAEKISGEEDWHEHAIAPKKGHVYIQKIDAQGQKMLVQFRIDDIEQDTLSVSWRTLEKLKGDIGQRGRAGTMGQCGGKHQTK